MQFVKDDLKIKYTYLEMCLEYFNGKTKKKNEAYLVVVVVKKEFN